MTKNEIIAYFKRAGYGCSYCGNTHTMYVHGISNGELHHHSIPSKGILLVAQKGG